MHSPLASAVAAVAAVAAVLDVGHVDGLLDSRLLVLAGGAGGVGIGVLLLASVVILGPLIVVSADLAGVLLVIVGVGGDGVVALTVARVEVAAVSLLGPLVVVVGTDGGGAGDGSTLLAGLVLTSSSVACLVLVALRGASTLAGGTVEVTVLAPSLGAPSVVVLVVPFVIGLGVVGLGPGGLVGLIDLEVLVAAIGIPVGARLAPGAGAALLGGGIELTLALAESDAVANTKLALGVGPDGGTAAIGISHTRVVGVVVLSPLVIIGLEPSGVLLVVVRASRDGIVRLAVSGVSILTVGLLGESVVVVAELGSAVALGGTLPEGVLSGVRALSTSVTGALAVATDATDTVAETLALACTVGLAVVSAVLAVLAGRGSLAVRRGTEDIAVLAPGLSAPLVGILVVPLIVRLSGVSLSAGLVVRDLLMEVLIATIGVPVLSHLAVVVTTTLGGGGLGVKATLLQAPALADVVLLCGGSLAVVLIVTGGVSVVVLSPLVVVSADLTGVVLVVVLASLNGVVGLAVSAVEVRAVSLLGPLVVIVHAALSGLLERGASLLLGTVSLGAVGLLGSSLLAVATGVAEGLLATVDLATLAPAVALAVAELLAAVALDDMSLVALLLFLSLGSGTVA